MRPKKLAAFKMLIRYWPNSGFTPRASPVRMMKVNGWKTPRKVE